MEGRKIMEGFIKVITSEKFYLPFSRFISLFSC